MFRISLSFGKILYVIASILFSFGVVLILLNLLGYVIPLRNPAVYHYFGDRQDPTLTYQQALQQIKRLPGEGAEMYVYRLNHVINRAMSPYWYDQGIDTYHLRVPIWENYILWYASFIDPAEYLHYEFIDYHKALERGIGLCSEYAIIATEVLEQNGIDAKMIALNGHVVSSANVNGKWYIVDAIYNVVIPHSLEEIEKDPTIATEYYKNSAAPPVIPSYYASASDNTVVDGVESYAPARVIRDEYWSYREIWILPLELMAPFALFKLVQILIFSYKARKIPFRSPS